MNWYKFIIYFALFAGAVLNAINGFASLTGAQYGEYKDAVYNYFESLKIIDVIFGIACLGLAAFGIYVRTRLAGFCKDAPQLLIKLYTFAIAASVLYLIAISAIASDNGVNIDLSSSFASVAISVIMLFANLTYFNKRAHLFVN